MFKIKLTYSCACTRRAYFQKDYSYTFNWQHVTKFKYGTTPLTDSKTFSLLFGGKTWGTCKLTRYGRWLNWVYVSVVCARISGVRNGMYSVDTALLIKPRKSWALFRWIGRILRGICGALVETPKNLRSIYGRCGTFWRLVL